MKFLHFLDKWVTKTNYVFFCFAAFLTFCLIILTFSSVLARYFFGISYVWLDELQWHLFGLSFLLSAAYTLSEGGHVRVDIIYGRLSIKTKALIDLILTIIFMLPLCGLIIYFGCKYAYSSYQITEISDSPNGLPYRYLIKSMIPFGFSLLFLQGLSFLFRQIFILAGQKESKGNA